MSAPLLLSKRKAAKILGVSRGQTLDRWLEEGHIRPTIVDGEVKIALEELERFAREGTEPAPVPRAHAHRRTKSAGDAIRAIKI